MRSHASFFDGRLVIAALLSALSLASAAQTRDTTGPTLTSVQLPTQAVAGRQIKVPVTVTDDLSGISQVCLFWNGGTDSFSACKLFQDNPTSFTGPLVSDIKEFVRPGIYQLHGAYLRDAAGNSRDVLSSDLAALGNVQIKVVNEDHLDSTAPTLISGRLLTPRKKRTDLHPGTTKPALLELELQLSDTGQTQPSGLWYETATFCQAAGKPCFDLSLYHQTAPYPRALSSVRLVNSSSTPLSGMSAGTYLLKSIFVRDQANNQRFYIGTDFGGRTDFASLISGTTITLE